MELPKIRKETNIYSLKAGYKYAVGRNSRGYWMLAHNKWHAVLVWFYFLFGGKV